MSSRFRWFVYVHCSVRWSGAASADAEGVVYVSRNVAERGATRKMRWLFLLDERREGQDETRESICLIISVPRMPIKLCVWISACSSLLSPSNHNGGEYVFHQKTVTFMFSACVCPAIVDDIMDGIAS